MKRVVAIGVLLLALTGCGTVKNFSRESQSVPVPYGGVKIAVTQFNEDPIAVALMWPFWATDVVLSAAGDTLTLPIAVTMVAWRACDLALHYDNTPPRSIAGHGAGFSRNDGSFQNAVPESRTNVVETRQGP